MSVFSKIFISFWLALILSIIVTAIVHPFREPPRGSAFRESTAHLLTAYGQTMVHQLELGQASEIGSPIRSLGQANGVQLYLLDNRGNDVTGRTVPNSVRLFLAEANDEDRDRRDRANDHTITSQQLTDKYGSHYLLVADFPNGIPQQHPGTLVWITRLGSLFVVSGVVCFLLARYLTIPIVRLRGATQQFASGQLHVRAPARDARKDEIALLVNDFNRMAERIEDLITLQRRLITDISHEFRSPLARLSIAIGVLRQRTGPEASSTLDRLERDVERLNRLIGQLLTLSACEDAEYAGDSAEINLAEIAAEVASDADYEARDRNCRVNFESDRECPVWGNRELLRTAIANILHNAVSYTAPGSTVEMTLGNSIMDGITMAVLSVRDHGPGVPERELESIFRPFYRLADARDRQSGGVGLGLAISDRAVRLQGGVVQALNAADGGLIVKIHIPVDRPAGSDQRPTAQENGSKGYPMGMLAG